jgi:hypothetical protein
MQTQKPQFEPMKLRSVMKWGVKTKKTQFINGKLVVTEENKTYVAVKFLDVVHMHNIIRMLEKQPDAIWNRFPASEWIDILKWEIEYQNKRVNVFISEVMKLKYNIMADLFCEYEYLAFQPM